MHLSCCLLSAKGSQKNIVFHKAKFTRVFKLVKGLLLFGKISPPYKSCWHRFKKLSIADCTFLLVTTGGEESRQNFNSHGFGSLFFCLFTPTDPTRRLEKCIYGVLSVSPPPATPWGLEFVLCVHVLAVIFVKSACLSYYPNTFICLRRG